MRQPISPFPYDLKIVGRELNLSLAPDTHLAFGHASDVFFYSFARMSVSFIALGTITDFFERQPYEFKYLFLRAIGSACAVWEGLGFV